jgi:hypothetical protein
MISIWAMMMEEVCDMNYIIINGFLKDDEMGDLEDVSDDEGSKKAEVNGDEDKTGKDADVQSANLSADQKPSTLE